VAVTFSIPGSPVSTRASTTTSLCATSRSWPRSAATGPRPGAVLEDGPRRLPRRRRGHGARRSSPV